MRPIPITGPGLQGLKVQIGLSCYVAFLVKHLIEFSLEETMNKLKNYKIIRHGFAVV